MRTSTILSAAVLGLLLGAGWSAFGQSAAQPEPGSVAELLEAGQGLVAVELDGNETADALAVIDPVARRVAVYQVDRSSGAITLRSVRNVTWDLQLDEFNGTKPTPREIRSQVDPR